jgi:hypothetical protein
MTNWIATSGAGTAHHYAASLTLADESSAVSGVRSLRLENIGDGTRITYLADEPALARAEDGDGFPVAFDLCVTIGDRAVAASLACQPKNTGLLCHIL